MKVTIIPMGIRMSIKPIGLFLLALLVACAPVSSPTASNDKLQVVATFSILGDLVQQVGGEQIELHTLVGPEQDAHSFEVTPSEGARLAQAGLIFENGLGFETWLDDLYTASGSTARRIIVTQNITPIKLGAETDPHVWHDVARVIQMVDVIREALVLADPEHAATYTANAAAYRAQLQALDEWIVTQVKTLPDNRFKLVTTHDSLGYFAQRYGFEVVGTVLPTATDGASPSAQELAQLVTTVRVAGVPALFTERGLSDRLLRQVADEAGVTVIASLYTDALGQPDSTGDTYLHLMRANVTTIINALQP